MIYSLYHPDGFYMCDIEIRENDSAFNKAQVNDLEMPTFNPALPRWQKCAAENTQKAFDYEK